MYVNDYDQHSIALQLKSIYEAQKHFMYIIFVSTQHIRASIGI